MEPQGLTELLFALLLKVGLEPVHEEPHDPDLAQVEKV